MTFNGAGERLHWPRWGTPYWAKFLYRRRDNFNCDTMPERRGKLIIYRVYELDSELLQILNEVGVMIPDCQEYAGKEYRQCALKVLEKQEDPVDFTLELIRKKLYGSEDIYNEEIRKIAESLEGGLK